MDNLNYTLITGASTGIGKAMANYCGQLGMNLLLVSLPGEELGKTALELSDRYHVKTDFFETNLSDCGDAPLLVFEWTKKHNYSVNILVNNAGIAGTSVFEDSTVKYIDERILVNIRALVLLTRYFLPELKKHDRSFILNTASLSAFFSIPYKSLYSATKAFVVSFSRSVKYELQNSKVSISVVCPNGVRTNRGTHVRIESHGKIGNLVTSTAEEVARYAINGMLAKKFMLIPGRINRFILILNKILPAFLKQKILLREFQKEVKVS